MKLLFCSDLHGHEDHYARLVRLARNRQPDVIILGGDLLPDDSALAPERMGVGQPEFVRRRFREVLAALRDACSVRATLAIFGNHDWRSSVEAMKELAGEGLITLLEFTKPVEINGLAFLGYSYTPPTPWYVKDFERLDVRGDRLPLLGGATWDPRFSKAASHSAAYIFESAPAIADDMATLKPPPSPWVFVAHAPPFESNLDRTYGNAAWGSRAIREAIEKYQPMLSLHGHIHQSPAVTGKYREDIGKTIALNAGQTEAKLNYLVVEVNVAQAKVTQVEHGQEE